MTHSLATGPAGELAATSSAAYLGTASTAVPLWKTTAPQLTTQRDVPPRATGYSFEIVVEPAISTGLRIEEGFKALPLPEKSPSSPPLLPASSTPSSSTGQAPQFRC
ncbi:hypothetical protein EDB85DRAFT_1894905 [Lactarius pseudohatsudake]|nr:hypothetical protein EDB85DRAFT_1894905 [Lactarius pseudohatsudake]